MSTLCTIVQLGNNENKNTINGNEKLNINLKENKPQDWQMVDMIDN